MTCAKQRVLCTLTHPDGRRWIGENRCERPQAVCPRDAHGYGTGQGYHLCKSVCGQVGHAELEALRLAGAGAIGATASLSGHDYFCRECQLALFAAGVAALTVERKAA